MPVKDPKRRKELTDAWKKRRYKPEYHKWLYARRALRFERSDKFYLALRDVQVLLRSRRAEDHQRARAIVDGTLLWALAREKEVGNRFNHDAARGEFFDGSPEAALVDA